MRRIRRQSSAIATLLNALLLATLLAACAAPPTTGLEANAVLAAPEAASGYTEKPGWYARSFMVAAANPLAADAGYQVLREGGSAVDAAIATQMVLGLVEPQSSGLGGGAFMLHFDGAHLTALDGRETAPAAADEKLFQDAAGRPLPYVDGLIGGRSVGVPGVLRMLESAHIEHGRVPWRRLLAPAIQLAEQGFEVSPRLAKLLREDP
jgi:gamma-glutamyltranspeptidase/glutathione hydrolase